MGEPVVQVNSIYIYYTTFLAGVNISAYDFCKIVKLHITEYIVLSILPKMKKQLKSYCKIGAGVVKS